jgi:hypothetical protein
MVGRGKKKDRDFFAAIYYAAIEDEKLFRQNLLRHFLSKLSSCTIQGT